MDISKYRDIYLNEAAEHLQKMGEMLVALEAHPQDADLVAALFREVHSIKGMAATMGYDATARLAHHLEDNLDLSRRHGGVSSTQIDQLLGGVDLLEGLVEDVRQDRPEREVEHYFAGAAAQEIPTVELEELVDPSGEAAPESGDIQLVLKLADTVAAIGPRLLVLLGQLAGLGRVLESVPSEAEILQGQTSRRLQVLLQSDLSRDQLREELGNNSELAAIEFPSETPLPAINRKPTAPSATVRVGTDLLDHFINLTGELITTRYTLQAAASARNWRSLDEGLGQLARLVKNLHHQVLQVRMMPLDTVTGRLPRLVRDLCRAGGKDVQFLVEGGGIELDRAILENLSDPLVHMLRNAIDHGIEQQGTVRVKAWRERDQVLIQVADDGRGIDPELIRRKALANGLLSLGQAQAMRDFDLLQLICQPGFSTSEAVSETSGRGVGMDVVKTAVERLGGVLLIDSAPGEGSRITMKLPLSVAIIRVLMIECDEVLMAMPITRVLQTIEVTPREIQTSGKQLVISFAGELLPLLSLRKILQRPKKGASPTVPVVVTEALGRKIGLVVDRLVGQREVFVQTLPAPFDGLRGNSGGTILGDGRIMFVLDLQSLLERRQG